MSLRTSSSLRAYHLHPSSSQPISSHLAGSSSFFPPLTPGRLKRLTDKGLTDTENDSDSSSDGQVDEGKKLTSDSVQLCVPSLSNNNERGKEERTGEDQNSINERVVMDGQKKEGQKCDRYDRGFEERGIKWLNLLQGRELRQKFAGGVYHKLSQCPSPWTRQILKDINRTFPSLDFFRSSPSRKQTLFRIIKAYSVYDGDVGYAQGMAFLAGFLYLHMKEEEAFWCLVRLMYTPAYNLRTLFLFNSDSLARFLLQLDRLLIQFLPKLSSHFSSEGIDASMYATQWFLTLFLYRFPFHLVPDIWSLLVERGVLALFQVALSLLAYFESSLLTMTFEDIIPFFNSLTSRKIPVYVIHQHASQSSLTSQDLSLLSLPLLSRGC